MKHGPEHLRIAWLADIFDEISGVITDTIEMYSKAKSKGYTWLPITSYKEEMFPFHNFEPVVKLDAGSYYEGSNIYFPNIVRVIKYLRDHKINVIVSNTPASVGLTAISAAKYLDIPLVDIYHTDVDFYTDILATSILSPILNRSMMTFVKMYQKSADMIFVRTGEYYDLMIKKGHPASKLRFYPAGINSDDFNPLKKDRNIWSTFNIPPDKKVVLYVGRITKVKDIDFLLRAFDKNNYDNAVLVLVGTGPEFDLYQKNYGSNRKIFFLGKQMGEQLKKIYASSDLYVLPSASETLGKTVLEAMASSIPVIVSDKGGPKEYVTDKKSGYIFKAGDYDDFEKILTGALENTDLLSTMGHVARESVAEHTDEKLFQKFTGHLSELI